MVKDSTSIAQYAFIIVDCSGSMNIGGVQKIGQLNDLLRILIGEFHKANTMTGIVIYSDTAEFYKSMSQDGAFYEFAASKFCGRSNLGKAYELISYYIDKNKISIADCMLALISDGAATDDYMSILKRLDSENKSKRIGFSIGSESSTLKSHVNLQDGLLFRDEKRFIAKATDMVLP